MKKWIFILMMMPLLGFSKVPTLSESAEVHIITCGPYNSELYSAFGHSAVRVFDSVQRINIIYNYGVFDYNQPNFYLNFAKGFLNYQLARNSYEPFINNYIRENRYVHEQVLNLSRAQKQSFFDYLETNAQPENKNYFYDYFYNNCATKVRDAVVDIYSDNVVFHSEHIKTHYSVRDLTGIYLKEQPWGRLGIDLCLGSPIDGEVEPWVYMFLPDYIESAFEHAQIKDESGILKPLVKRTIFSYESTEVRSEANWNRPELVFGIFLLLGLLAFVLGKKRNSNFFAFDFVLFFITGFIGVFLTCLWLLTDHDTAAYNYNILWAMPLNLIFAFALLKKKRGKSALRYFKIIFVINILILANWFWLPQNINTGFLPLIALLALRSYWITTRIKKEIETV